jgi:nitrile hydratase accessory protein
MSTAAALADVDAALGLSAPLPRANGELVFEEVWQGRALGLGVVVLERTGALWSEFREHLVAAITAHVPAPGESPATAYYTAWLDAVETLLAARGVA